MEGVEEGFGEVKGGGHVIWGLLEMEVLVVLIRETGGSDKLCLRLRRAADCLLWVPRCP